MKTHIYYKDGQKREVTGTDEEIAAEIAGIPWLPPAPAQTVMVLDAPPPAEDTPPSGSETTADTAPADATADSAVEAEER